MTNDRRLTSVKVALTPKQAVHLHLRQNCQGKSTSDYLGWLLKLPPHAAPKTLLRREITRAIQSAMGKEDPHQIRRAVRQALMQAEFLMELVAETNTAALTKGLTQRFQISILVLRLCCNFPDDQNDESFQDWLDALRAHCMELLAYQAATERIRDKYFDGENILFENAREALGLQTAIAEGLLAMVDESLAEENCPELLSDSDKTRALIDASAERIVSDIVAFAKSTVFRDFGEPWSARNVLMPFLRRTLGDDVPHTGN